MRNALLLTGAIGLSIASVILMNVDLLVGHPREAVGALFLVCVGAAIVLAAIAAVRRGRFAAVPVAAAVGCGAGAIVSLVYLRPGILPWVEQSEGDAHSALANLVDNGSMAIARNNSIHLIEPETVADVVPIAADLEGAAEPAWSPDGERLAFTSSRAGNRDIYTMKSDGSEVVRLTKDVSDDGYPTWSPDGTQMAFTSSRDGNSDIYVMNADGSDLRRVTRHEATDREPSWAPDGRRIAFTSDRAGNDNVAVINVDGTEFQQLSSELANDSQPAWSPDGSELLFTSTRDGDSDIYRYYVKAEDEPNVDRVTFNDIRDSSPVWAPDGGKFAFVREDETVGSEPTDAVIVVQTSVPPGTKPNPQSERKLSGIRVVVGAHLSWQPRPRANLEIPDDEPVDARTEALLYAPVVYLHPFEVRLPMDPTEFVARSELVCRGETYDDVDVGALPFRPLGTETANDAHAQAFASCATVVPALRLEDQDSQFGTRSRSSTEGLYNGSPVLWESSTDMSDRWITYWFFYASSLTAGKVGLHMGDWERATVCLPAESPPKVVYHRHETSESRPWAWARKLRTHPIVYSAKGSHASYPTNVRRNKDTQDLTHEGLIWPTWKDLKRVNDEPWYGYRGRWGSIPGPSLSRTGGEGC